MREMGMAMDEQASGELLGGSLESRPGCAGADARRAALRGLPDDTRAARQTSSLTTRVKVRANWQASLMNRSRTIRKTLAQRNLLNTSFNRPKKLDFTAMDPRRRRGNKQKRGATLCPESDAPVSANR